MAAFSVCQGLTHHHPPPLGLSSPLALTAPGCRVSRAKVTLLQATGSSVEVLHEPRDHVRGSRLVWDGSPRWYL